VAEPDAAGRAAAAEAAAAAYRRAVRRGLPTAEAAVDLLRPPKAASYAAVAAGDHWDKGDDAALADAEAAVDRLKQLVYKHFHRADRVAPFRAELAAAKARAAALHARKHALYAHTADHHAAAARVRAAVGRGLRRADGAPAWADWRRDRTGLLDAAVAAYLAARPSAAQVRELARTDPWRSAHAAREACGGAVFPVPAAALSDDQRALANWTRAYDAAAQDPDGPGEAAAADDDAFDGYLLARRAGDGDRGRRREAVTDNEKIKAAQQVFVFEPDGSLPDRPPLTEAERAAFVDGVYDLNDGFARDAVAARLAAVDRAGTLDEMDAPDQKAARRGVRVG
jgi:hypothetical protein